jgi:hypothetical protein
MVACRPTWMGERPRRSSMPHPSHFARLPAAALVVSSVFSSLKFAFSPAPDTSRNHHLNLRSPAVTAVDASSSQEQSPGRERLNRSDRDQRSPTGRGPTMLGSVGNLMLETSHQVPQEGPTLAPAGTEPHLASFRSTAGRCFGRFIGVLLFAEIQEQLVGDAARRRAYRATHCCRPTPGLAIKRAERIKAQPAKQGWADPVEQPTSMDYRVLK